MRPAPSTGLPLLGNSPPMQAANESVSVQEGVSAASLGVYLNRAAADAASDAPETARIRILPPTLRILVTMFLIVFSPFLSPC